MELFCHPSVWSGIGDETVAVMEEPAAPSLHFFLQGGTLQENIKQILPASRSWFYLLHYTQQEGLLSGPEIFRGEETALLLF